MRNNYVNKAFCVHVHVSGITTAALIGIIVGCVGILVCILAITVPICICSCLGVGVGAALRRKPVNQFVHKSEYGTYQPAPTNYA